MAKITLDDIRNVIQEEIKKSQEDELDIEETKDPAPITDYKSEYEKLKKEHDDFVTEIETNKKVTKATSEEIKKLADKI
jgi:Skp family chaperone for outer membrane proteins